MCWVAARIQMGLTYHMSKKFKVISKANIMTNIPAKWTNIPAKWTNMIKAMVLGNRKSAKYQMNKTNIAYFWVVHLYTSNVCTNNKLRVYTIRKYLLFIP